jgi:flagellar basal-body rod protein FlgB
MDNGILGVLQFAIDGVTSQQNATANNLSNSQTPDFTAKDVSFEESLAKAIGSPDPAVAQITTADDGAPSASNGNNVDLGAQLIDSEKETLQYSSISEAINSQLSLIRGVSGGSFQ